MLKSHLQSFFRWLKLWGKTSDRAQVERLLPLLEQPHGVPGQITWRGNPLHYLDGPSVYYQLAEIYVAGVHDFDHSEHSTPCRILDVGGNIGLASIRLRERFPDADITTFEADPTLAKVLQKNLHAFGDRDTKVIAAAAWRADGKIGFRSSGGDDGSIDHSSSDQVEAVDLGRYLYSTVDYLKIDIEGAEFEVLPHLASTGALQRVNRLGIEIHHWNLPTPPRFHELFQILVDAGFNYRILSSTLNPADIWRHKAECNSQLFLAAWKDDPHPS